MNTLPLAMLAVTALIAAPAFAADNGTDPDSLGTGGLPQIVTGETSPDSLASLPKGFEDGTAAMQHYQVLRHYYAEPGQR